MKTMCIILDSHNPSINLFRKHEMKNEKIFEVNEIFKKAVRSSHISMQYRELSIFERGKVHCL